MGVTTFIDELTSAVAPARLFKALIVDSNTLFPKLLPHFIKSIDVIQGDGGAGTIEQINFTEASSFKLVKHRVDELDRENLICKYTMIEGDPLGDKLEKIAHEIRFEATNNGGCVSKMTSHYYAVGDFEVQEEEYKSGRDSGRAVFKVVETYLLENPHLYS